ncbi:hypothetical protein GTP58_13330 [Duganella sp. CY15W]|uniref:putative quinol monooxygenase n=1 Tax=Duganella sp. CY15W TaxID=2692172 RepID=UPI00136A6ECB|nr:antibiotic biosynthesis monooxygenase [Duganella sp. CY15W]MYM29306.1 hypothetical protein [Duganella sp. CY15W]
MPKLFQAQAVPCLGRFIFSHRAPIATGEQKSLLTRAACLLASLSMTTAIYAQTPSTLPVGTTAASVAAETGFIIKFKIKLGRNADFEQAIGEVLAAVRKHEPGNVYCDLFHLSSDETHVADPQTYVIMERYKDAYSANKHAESDYLKKLRSNLAELLDGPPTVEPLALLRSK